MTNEVQQETQPIDYKRIAEIAVPALTEIGKEIAKGTKNKIDDQVFEVLDKIADSMYPQKTQEN